MQIEFWRNQLEGAPELLALPTTQGRPHEASSKAFNIPFSITPALLQAVRQLVKAQGCTLIMFFTAAYQVCANSNVTQRNSSALGGPSSSL